MDISECKMGSIIYTYQRSKRKPIPLTDERIQTLKDHEKFLMGKVAGTKPVNNWRLEESQNFTVAPAYNKGAYQVINKSDVKDIGR